MNKKNLNFAIIGVGYWGPNYARILSELHGVKLTWCCDKDVNALKKMQKRYPGISVTKEFTDILKDYSLDSIIVVTPAYEHYNLVAAALDAGKDILVEKPLAINISQADELVRLANKKKRILAVDHTFKFNPGIRKLKEIMKAGLLGKIYYLYGLYNALGPIRKDVSAMWDISPHFIYAANFLLDELPVSISARGKSFLLSKMEDVVFLNVEYKSGILFNLHSSWLDPLKIRQLVVVGSKKMAVFDDLSIEGKLKIYDNYVSIKRDPNFANLSIILRYGNILIPKLEEKEPLKELVLDFINSVRRRKKPLAPAEEGLEVVKILSAAQYSLEHQGKPVFIKK